MTVLELIRQHEREGQYKGYSLYRLSKRRLVGVRPTVHRERYPDPGNGGTYEVWGPVEVTEARQNDSALTVFQSLDAKPVVLHGIDRLPRFSGDVVSAETDTEEAVAAAGSASRYRRR